MSDSKKVDIIFTIIGFIIMFSLAILSIVDSHATNVVSGVAPTIFGAALFVSGYIGFKIDNNK